MFASVAPKSKDGLGYLRRCIAQRFEVSVPLNPFIYMLTKIILKLYKTLNHYSISNVATESMFSNYSSWMVVIGTLKQQANVSYAMYGQQNNAE